jgi:acyl carrier protein
MAKEKYFGGFMQHLVSEERVVEEIKKSIGESLRIDPASIAAENSLIQDLGAESLDFLDINYRLEQAFGIRMARHFVLEHVEELFGEGSAIDDQGQLTERGAQLLRIRLGDRQDALKAGMELDQATALITVQSMARGIMDILNSLAEGCPHCGGASWQSDNGARVRCGSCGKDALFKNGDELIQEWLKKVQEEKKIFPS